MKKSLLAITAVLLMLSATAGAQDYRGSFAMPLDNGELVFHIRYTADGIEGELTNSWETYAFAGGIDELGIFGTVYSGEPDLYFEGELHGEELYMIIAPIDAATGEPDSAAAAEYTFQRTQAPTDPATPGRLLTPPTATDTPDAPQAQPDAATQPAGMVRARVGQRYEAGSRIGSADAGVSFTVPGGYYAGYHPGENAFVVVSDTQPGLLTVDARSFMAVDDALQELSRTFASGGVTIQPQGAPQVTAGAARARFTVFSPQGEMALYVVGVAGSSGNVLIVSGLGLASETAHVEQLVETIAGSATFSGPTRTDALDAANRLAGVRLRVSSGSGSTGGLGDAYSNTTMRLDLCSAGNYQYEYNYRFSAQVDGLSGTGISASHGDLKQEAGRWEVVSGLLGPVLVLHSNQDGSQTYVPLLEEAGVLYADGLAVTTGTSPLCG